MKKIICVITALLCIGVAVGQSPSFRTNGKVIKGNGSTDLSDYNYALLITHSNDTVFFDTLTYQQYITYFPEIIRKIHLMDEENYNFHLHNIHLKFTVIGLLTDSGDFTVEYKYEHSIFTYNNIYSEFRNLRLYDFERLIGQYGDPNDILTETNYKDDKGHIVYVDKNNNKYIWNTAYNVFTSAVFF